MSPTSPVRVSVVVPVYNPGTHIDALIESLAAQSMPHQQFEVIFSDDGSTDETPERLDQLAEEWANVTVLHEPNSGWPGRPRNLGTDAAHGKYVFFADQDDWLGEEALQRMCDYADENSSDVVIGRYAGHHRGVAKALFSRSRPRATPADTPLMDSLTPHKMFRKAFLTEHGLRFPEGRRRLEDHVFVVSAYLLADRISVLADYHCYFHVSRSDAGNAGYRQIDPAGYYSNVREVVAIVMANTEPGAVRNRFLRRTLTHELLGRLDGRSILAQSATYQRKIFEQAHDIATESIPASVDTGLNPVQRVRATLLRQGRLDDLLACTEAWGHAAPTARLVGLTWTGSGLSVEAEAVLRDARTGQPWRYVAEGGSYFLRAPRELRGEFPRAEADCTASLQSPGAHVVMRRRADSQEWVVATTSAAQIHDDGDTAWASLRAAGTIDPRTLAAGHRLASGIWDVYLRVSQTGWSRDVRLGSVRDDELDSGCVPALSGETAFVPYWTHPHGNLSIDLTGSRRAIGRIRDAQVGGPPGRCRLTIALTSLDPTPPAFELRRADAVPLAPVPTASTDMRALTAELPPLDPGQWTVALSGRDGAALATGVGLDAHRNGSVTVRTASSAPPSAARPPARPDAVARLEGAVLRVPWLARAARRVRRLARTAWAKRPSRHG
jgi:glycosyltransferase involved in cell wall biosynthesis